MNVRAILPGNAGHHAVQIYRDDSSWRESVADFLADGLAANQPTVVIATAHHCDLLVSELTGRRFDVPALLTTGSLSLIDAHELLDVIAANARIEVSRFREAVGMALDRVLASGAERSVRAYGEMVDVLWRDGRPEAALQLELLSNDLLTKYPLSLLCGYQMDAFLAREEHREVCACHTHVHYASAV